MSNPGTVFVIAEFCARKGQEQALKAVLNALIPPTRREPSCLQYDLLADAGDPAKLVFLERWETDDSLERHLLTAHVQIARKDWAPLVESEPDIRRLRKL